MRLTLSLGTLIAVFCVTVAAPAMAINVPEPASMGLFAVGAGVLAAIRMRRRK